MPRGHRFDTGRAMRLLLAAVLISGAAVAQEATDPVAGRTLFGDARKLANEGRYQEACPKFEESQRLYPGIGTLFNLADCWEHVGRTASAWARFLDVAGQARAAGQLQREQVARDRAAGLEPRLSRLTVEVTETSGIEVRKDGVPLGKPLWAVPVPTDPGSHTVEARAPGRVTFRVTAEVPAEAGRVVVKIPELEALHPTRAPIPVSSDRAKDAERADRAAVGIILGGTGIAALLVGALAGFASIHKNDQASRLCTDANSQGQFVCHSEIEQRSHELAVDDAKQLRTIAIAALGAGGALTVGGATIVLSAWPTSRSSSEGSMNGRIGLTVRGAF